MVWQLPAPCHKSDFRILGLYEAKAWLRERGFQDIEIEHHGSKWTITACDHPAGSPLTAAGGSDVEAALRLVLQVLGSV
ncbi:MAG: hypothetical protein HYT87_04910 [Nitrospirae bacterium]|nr:hypothetical protein [Nitrospirota bacterium]